MNNVDNSFTIVVANNAVLFFLNQSIFLSKLTYTTFSNSMTFSVMLYTYVRLLSLDVFIWLAIVNDSCEVTYTPDGLISV